MKCPICSEKLLPGTSRCTFCGYRVRTSGVPAEASPAPRSARSAQPKRRKGCLVLLLWPLILSLLSTIFNVTVNIVDDFSNADSEIAIHEDAPAREPRPAPTVPASRPAPADDGCFAIEDGAGYFLADRWDGSPILTIPDTVDGQSVTAIGPGCFRDCEALTTIILPDAVTEICSEAFAGCSGLRGLYLPLGTTSIGADAFAGCISLEAICIPAQVDSIAPGCFDDCASLMYIIYEGSFEHWEALYDDYINPFTTAICIEGSYYHGTGR